jgi:hypothetical protein
VEEVLVAVPQDARCSCRHAGKVMAQNAARVEPIVYAISA